VSPFLFSRSDAEQLLSLSLHVRLGSLRGAAGVHLPQPPEPGRHGRSPDLRRVHGGRCWHAVCRPSLMHACLIKLSGAVYYFRRFLVPVSFLPAGMLTGMYSSCVMSFNFHLFLLYMYVCVYVCMYESRDWCSSLHFMCCWNHMIFLNFMCDIEKFAIAMYVCMHDLPVLLRNQLKTDGSPQPLVMSVYLSAETVSNVCVSVWSRSM
jgi:hypothetical protein